MYVVGETKENGAYFHGCMPSTFLPARSRQQPGAHQSDGSRYGQWQLRRKTVIQPVVAEQSRPALNYYNGHIYIGFGAHGDNGPWHGWVFAYDATTLAQTAVICTFAERLWQWGVEAGAGMPIDTGVTGGRMFLTTGNGTYATYPPFNASSEFGDSIVAIRSCRMASLTPIDAFTPFNQAKLSALIWIRARAAS